MIGVGIGAFTWLFRDTVQPSGGDFAANGDWNLIDFDT